MQVDETRQLVHPVAAAPLVIPDRVQPMRKNFVLPLALDKQPHISGANQCRVDALAELGAGAHRRWVPRNTLNSLM